MRPATMVERACPNDGVNMIPIVDRFAERFEYQSSHSLSGNEPVVTAAVAVSLSVERKHASLAQRFVFRGMQIQVDAARDRELAFAISQAFAGEMDRNQ